MRNRADKKLQNDRPTDRQTDGPTDKLTPVYPPNRVLGGIIKNIVGREKMLVSSIFSFSNNVFKSLPSKGYYLWIAW